MTAVQALYAERVTTAAEAVRRITSGMRVYLTGNCSVPQTLFSALVQRAPARQGVGSGVVRGTGGEHLDDLDVLQLRRPLDERGQQGLRDGTVPREIHAHP